MWGIKAIVPARWSETRWEQAEEPKKRPEDEVRTLASHKKAKEALKVVRDASKSQCCRRTTAKAPEGTKVETANLKAAVPKASPERGSERTH